MARSSQSARIDNRKKGSIPSGLRDDASAGILPQPASHSKLKEDDRVGDSDNVDISVFVPINNEESSIPHLYQELTAVLTSLGRPYEIIAVDDGSTDNSLSILTTLRQKDERLKIIQFARNFGLTPAMSAAIDHARGKIIVGIDADLEQDPKDIPRLIEKLEEGYDVVSGWRQNKWKNGWKNRFLRRLPTQTANLLIRKITGVQLQDSSCTLKAYRATFIKKIRLYGDMHRFVPVAASFLGARTTEVPVNFRERRYGRSHYGVSRTVKVLLDLIMLKFLQEYSTRPIQIFGGIGLLCGGLGSTLFLYLVYVRFLVGQAIADRPLLLVSMMLIVLAVQFIMMGLLGELVIRTYYESQNKPIYFIREKHL